MQTIEEICNSYSLTPRTVVECGASLPKHVRAVPFIKNGTSVILIEANPRIAYCLTHGHNDDEFKTSWPQTGGQPYAYSGFSEYTNVTIHNKALAAKHGTIQLCEFDTSSFVSGIMSPGVVNDKYIEQKEYMYEVPSIPISDIDDGTIDVLLADVEGSEWFCIKDLVSRPKIIVLELYGWEYLNPYYDEIKTWMLENNYRFADRDTTDALFVRDTGKLLS